MLFPKIWIDHPCEFQGQSVLGRMVDRFIIQRDEKGSVCQSIILNQEEKLMFYRELGKYLGLGWKPFPDSFSGLPEVHKKYNVTRLDFEEKPIVDQRIFYNVDLWVVAKVIAFRELPAPYMPEATHES